MLQSKILTLAFLSILASCGSMKSNHKKPTLSAKSISMTKKLTSSTRFRKLSKVESEICVTDEKLIEENSSTFIYDEVIYQTQKKYNSDAILDAKFYENNGCVVLHGYAAKVL